MPPEGRGAGSSAVDVMLAAASASQAASQAESADSRANSAASTHTAEEDSELAEKSKAHHLAWQQALDAAVNAQILDEENIVTHMKKR